MSLTRRDLEIINLELTTTVQEMDQSIREGKRYSTDRITYLEEMRGTVAKVRQSMRSTSHPDLRVVA